MLWSLHVLSICSNSPSIIVSGSGGSSGWWEDIEVLELLGLGLWGQSQTGPTARSRTLLLDWDADQVAVLRPTAVIVAHVLQAEEVVQHKPLLPPPLP